jgi:hypothetical protein
VRPNCNISTINNCCPPGFAYDGANCRLENEFGSNTTGFIDGDGFYSGCVDKFKGDTLMVERMQSQSITNTTDLTAYVSLKPNPSSESVNLRYLSGSYKKVLTVKLVDAVGLVKQELRFDSGNTELDISVSLIDYPSGIYYFVLYDGVKQEVIRFVKI